MCRELSAGRLADMAEEIYNRRAGMRISVLLVRPDGTAMPLGSRPTDDRRPHSLANVCRATSLVRGHSAQVRAGDRFRVRLEPR